MRWLIVLFAVVLNIAGLVLVAAPMLVSYAEIPSRNVTCETCGTPEVQAALARAAAVGRNQVVGQLDRVFPVLVALGLINVAAIVVLTLSPRRRHAA
jgi:hypothetical protein